MAYSMVCYLRSEHLHRLVPSWSTRTKPRRPGQTILPNCQGIHPHGDPKLPLPSTTSPPQNPLPSPHTSTRGPRYTA